MCRPQHKMETWASCSKSRGIKLFSSSAVSFSTCHSALCILCNVLLLRARRCGPGKYRPSQTLRAPTAQFGAGSMRTRACAQACTRYGGQKWLWAGGQELEGKEAPGTGLWVRPDSNPWYLFHCPTRLHQEKTNLKIKLGNILIN